VHVVNEFKDGATFRQACQEAVRHGAAKAVKLAEKRIVRRLGVGASANHDGVAQRSRAALHVHKVRAPHIFERQVDARARVARVNQDKHFAPRAELVQDGSDFVIQK
jgi:hypothetical protein